MPSRDHRVVRSQCRREAYFMESARRPVSSLVAHTVRSEACGCQWPYIPGAVHECYLTVGHGGPHVCQCAKQDAYFILVCLRCAGRIPLIFTTQEARGKWAARHRRATGHDRWLCKDVGSHA